MALRNDHDAALARADALQAELDRERAAHADQTERIAQLERELAAARARLERAEDVLEDLKPPQPQKPPAPSPEPRVAEPPPAFEHRPKELSGRGALMIVGGILVPICVLTIAKCRVKETPHSTDVVAPELPRSPPPPRPPFVADALMREGLGHVGSGLVVREIAFDYVRADGTLDPTHGEVTFSVVKRRPPRPPDDPNRPTGAPAPPDRSMVDMMLADCPQPTWKPSVGWTTPRGSCLTFGEEPAAPPTCTPASVAGRARTEGAPDGLARIKVDSMYGVRGWTWTYSITDHARGVNFVRTYDDRDCPPPPVEK